MMLRRSAIAVLAIAAAPLQAAPEIPEDQVLIDAAAEAVLLDACAWLRDASAFTVQADISFDELTLDGARVEYHRQDQVALVRPDKLRLDVEDDRGQRSVYYDGKQVTVFLPGGGLFAVADAPDSLDATLDLADAKGIEMPLDDLLHSHPCEGIAENLRVGTYGGRHFMAGDWYHHLLLKTDAVDVQMWIADDEVPAIRKVVIAYSQALGTPQYRAFFSDWNFNPEISDEVFSFTPSEGDRQVPFRGASDREEAKK